MIIIIAIITVNAIIIMIAIITIITTPNIETVGEGEGLRTLFFCGEMYLPHGECGL